MPAFLILGSLKSDRKGDVGQEIVGFEQVRKQINHAKELSKIKDLKKILVAILVFASVTCLLQTAEGAPTSKSGASAQK